MVLELMQRGLWGRMITCGKNSSALYIDDNKVNLKDSSCKGKKVLTLLANFQMLSAIFFRLRFFLDFFLDLSDLSRFI